MLPGSGTEPLTLHFMDDWYDSCSSCIFHMYLSLSLSLFLDMGFLFDTACCLNRWFLFFRELLHYGISDLWFNPRLLIWAEIEVKALECRGFLWKVSFCVTLTLHGQFDIFFKGTGFSSLLTQQLKTDKWYCGIQDVSFFLLFHTFLCFYKT